MSARVVKTVMGVPREILDRYEADNEFLRDVKARAERVLDGTQTGAYTKRRMAHDILRLVEVARGR